MSTVIPQHPNTIPRPRLCAAIEASLWHRGTLLLAPAGSGKTSGLASWARNTTGKVSWLSLEPDDNHPPRFLRRLCAALREAHPSLGWSIEPAIYRGAASDIIGSLTRHVANPLGQASESLTLILDDVHHITHPALLHGISWLIEEGPSTLHGIVSAQTPPGLAISEGPNGVRRIDPEALAFSPADARSLLETVGVSGLSDADLGHLVRNAEGRPALVKVAGLALRSGLALPYVIEMVLRPDTLWQEVFVALPEAERMMLRAAALVQPLEQSLGTLLTGQERAGKTLEKLASEGLFLRTADAPERGFRLQPWAIARIRALPNPPPEQSTWRYQISSWFAARGHTAEALEYAIASGDEAWLIGLLERCADPLMIKGSAPLLRKAILALPREALRERPWLAVYDAWWALRADDVDIAETILDSAETRLSERLSVEPQRRALTRGHFAALRAEIAAHRSDHHHAMALRELAYVDLPADALLRPQTGLHLGRRYLADGDHLRARKVLMEARELAKKYGFDFLGIEASTLLARAYRISGLLNEADRICEQSIKAARTGSQATRAGIGTLLVERARLSFERFELTAAQADLLEALTLLRQSGTHGELAAAFSVQARVLLLADRPSAASQAIRDLESLAGDAGLTPALAGTRARILLGLRQHAPTEAWATDHALEAAGVHPNHHDGDYARFALSLLRRPAAEVADMLGQTHRRTLDDWRMAQALEWRCLLVVALDRSGRTGEALDHLGVALKDAGPHRIVRPFAEQWELLGPLVSGLQEEHDCSFLETSLALPEPLPLARALPVA